MATNYRHNFRWLRQKYYATVKCVLIEFEEMIFTKPHRNLDLLAVNPIPVVLKFLNAIFFRCVIIDTLVLESMVYLFISCNLIWAIFQLLRVHFLVIDAIAFMLVVLSLVPIFWFKPMTAD